MNKTWTVSTPDGNTQHEDADSAWTEAETALSNGAEFAAITDPTDADPFITMTPEESPRSLFA